VRKLWLRGVKCFDSRCIPALFLFCSVEVGNALENGNAQQQTVFHLKVTFSFLSLGDEMKSLKFLYVTDHKYNERL